jgi:4-hydroxybenzoate polyprenyltransferase
MSKSKAFIQLIRLPNLIFIGLTQSFTYTFIIKQNLNTSVASMPLIFYYMLVFSTLLIAAAGYIINDYFDIRIDAINKPEKVTIETIFKRRTIITWHIGLNIIALMIAGYLAHHFLQLRLLGIQFLIIFLLIVYSTTFKRKLISGNLIISLLTSFTIICMALYEPNFKLWKFSHIANYLFWLYVIFAFIITFIREIIKDAEDIKGDLMQHCRTIPLVWGINGAKKCVYFLISILLLVEMITFLLISKVTLSLVLFFGTFLPIIIIIPLVFKANTTFHFKQISKYLKWITLIGILSMLFL